MLIKEVSSNVVPVSDVTSGLIAGLTFGVSLALAGVFC
ncbi:hypothetical protein SDC9_180711 [bioreactor metagenome]|uniref:Uncharacterized protein n=1 Tax=bioreactor metagenome TaxID=1076179 RepID=A0A645H2I6_9ZZZZ